MKKPEEYGLAKVLTSIVASALLCVGIGLFARLVWESLRLGWNIVEIFL